MTFLGRRARIIAPLALLGAMIGAALVLQLLAGGVRDRALGPLVLAASVGAFGALIAAHRPGLRFGLLLTLTGLGFGLGSLAAGALDYGALHPIPRWSAVASFAVVSLTRALVGAWVAFIVWFPDGKPPSRRWRAFVVAATACCAAVAVLVWLVGPADRVFDFYQGTTIPPHAGGPFAGTWAGAAPASDLILILPVVALWSLVQRYRRGDAVRRQQVQWFILGGAVTLAAQFVGIGLASGHGAASDIGIALSVITQPLPMLAATLAILRYRLWDIDLVVSRALVYGVLWAALSALLLVPALAAGLLVGGRGAGTAVAIALLVTVAFHPARRRLEAFAQRVVYRHRARPYVLLSGFWETLREADLSRLGPLVADAVRAGLHVEWAGVWLALPATEGMNLRPVGVSGAVVPAGLAVSSATTRHLHATRALVLDGWPAEELAQLWPAAPEAVVPLAVADDLVGLLACGGRRGDRLRPADYELLELLARECALRLRNLRLEAQLRDRLAEIEAQAAELTRSRQRLVTAQDEERRRIERDLHDGAQQQLVSLAARLRRAVNGGSDQFTELAADAELAVFALQELGRGIYPSVLADQGLPAALRTQAARIPVAVRIDVDQDLSCRRLDREVEAALYFVALEALTNAQKHAPGAAISIGLRADDTGVVLEVADSGPGFDAEQPRDGTGLQNMHDRIAAVAGVLAVRSAAGHGTRVAAVVPAAPHQPGQADQPGQTGQPGQPGQAGQPGQPGQPVVADSRR